MAQYNKTTKQLLSDSKTLYEVIMLADKDGNVSDNNAGAYFEFAGLSADAFGRGRVSEPQTLGDYKHTYKDLNDFNDVLTSSATVTYSNNDAAATLTTIASSATSRAIHQTKRYHHYLPGKSQLILASFCFNANHLSSKKRIGYYDDKNGVFFERQVASDGTVTLKFVIRSFVTGAAVDTEITQANWNVDKCNGTTSDFNIDTTKTQLFFADFQWLGVGRVRCGFVHDGKYILAHQFLHSNNSDKVYWSNPNLPVRSEILNTAANAPGANMAHICSTVMSEGGYLEAGTDFEVQNTTAVATPLPGGTWMPILAVRLKNTFNTYDNRILFKPENVSLFADTKSIAYRIGKLPTAASLTGSPTWTSVATDSGCEYSVNATGVTIANFISFGGGFVAAGVSNGSDTASSPSILTESKRNLITQNFDSTNSEIFVVLARTLATGANDTANVWASLQWKEII
jgi:hypothetical protein